MADRNASATWQGDLFTGSGTVSATSSELFTEAGVTWAARTESADGKTSPEELIASAHAACFSMALANEMSSAGTVPSRIQVRATATFEPPTITKVALTVTVEAPGLDEDVFRKAISAAEGSCPVSNALRNNVEIEVDARLT
ncbi:MAG: OsmC family peroxiredoxin [Actinomycetota bacterium]|nr:OsmC family peroxiredoxin [Actinomycetota bacterium]